MRSGDAKSGSTLENELPTEADMAQEFTIKVFSAATGARGATRICATTILTWTPSK